MSRNDPNVALHRVVDRGINDVLLPAGFDPVSKLSWCRSTGELRHVVELLSRRGTYVAQWGVVSPEATWFLWGRDGGMDVGDAVMSGTAGSIRHPARAQSFRLDGTVDTDVLAADVAADMVTIDRWLRRFETRADLRTYLMENRDRKDRREFVIPANLPLKLYTAAVLAVIDGAEDADDLVTDAAGELERFDDELSAGRLSRLKHAVDGLR